TSRQARPGEQEGREYNFVTKEEMLRKIREGGMVEWGELDGQLYGTCADSVRSVVRSGRMCVLDCAPQALSHLYNSEFMPFVVHIIPPQLEEFLQLENLRHHRRPVDQLSKFAPLFCEILPNFQRHLVGENPRYRRTTRWILRPNDLVLWKMHALAHDLAKDH
ncbi:guanylate kinase, partial [Teladorsagia circumcincta]